MNTVTFSDSIPALAQAHPLRDQIWNAGIEFGPWVLPAGLSIWILVIFWRWFRDGGSFYLREVAADHPQWVMLCVTAILCVVLHSCANRYAVKGSGVLDRWTGETR